MITANTVIAIFTYEKMVAYHSDRLSSLLYSLKGVISPNTVVCVINTSVHPSGQSRVKLDAVCARYGDSLPIRIFSTEHLECLHTTLRQEGHSEFTSFVSFSNFACFRNIAILLASTLNSTALIMLDDDSMIVDQTFLTTAVEHLGPQHTPALFGKTGYYVEGSPTRPRTEQVPTRTSKAYSNFENHDLWPKSRLIAKTLRSHLMATDRFYKSPMALGGTLVLHRYLYKRLPFDPFCPRGEDTDYMLSAWNEGIEFLFDQKHRVAHAPIEARYAPCDKLKQDVDRFMYMRAKLKTFKRVSQNDLYPYPGIFLGDDLEARAVKLCHELHDTETSLGRFHVAQEYLSLAGHIQCGDLVDRRRMIARYFNFKERWPQVVSDVRSVLTIDQLSRVSTEDTNTNTVDRSRGSAFHPNSNQVCEASDEPSQ